MKKIIFVLLSIGILIILSTKISVSSIVTPISYHECDFTYIEGIECKDQVGLIDNEIVKKSATINCNLFVKIGKCLEVDYQKRSRYSYYPYCDINMYSPNDNNKSLSINENMSNKNKGKIEYPISLIFNDLGEQELKSDLICNGTFIQSFVRRFDIVTIKEFSNIKEMKKQNDFNRKAFYISSLISSLLTIFLILSSFVQTFKTKKILIKEVDNGIYKNIKEILQKFRR